MKSKHSGICPGIDCYDVTQSRLKRAKIDATAGYNAPIVVGAGGAGGLGGAILAFLYDIATHQAPLPQAPIIHVDDIFADLPARDAGSLLSWLRSVAPWDYVLIFLLGLLAGPVVDGLFLLRRAWARFIDPLFARPRPRYRQVLDA